jgi:hypothetical protein
LREIKRRGFMQFSHNFFIKQYKKKDLREFWEIKNQSQGIEENISLKLRVFRGSEEKKEKGEDNLGYSCIFLLIHHPLKVRNSSKLIRLNENVI